MLDTMTLRTRTCHLISSLLLFSRKDEFGSVWISRRGEDVDRFLHGTLSTIKLDVK